MSVSTISVIVPVYRTIDYLDEVFESLLGQTRHPTEVIVVNDGCSENVTSTVEPWLQKLPIKLIHHDENRGTTQARRTGILAASSEFCIQLDSDDSLAPHALQEMIEAIVKHGADFACCRMNVTELDGSLRASAELAEALLVATGDDALNELGKPQRGKNSDTARGLAHWRLGAAGGKLFRREIAAQASERMSFSHCVYAEDSLFALLCFALSDVGVFLPQKLYNYTLRTTSTQTTKLTKDRDKFLTDYRNTLDMVSAFLDSPEVCGASWQSSVNDWLATQNINYFTQKFDGVNCFTTTFSASHEETFVHEKKLFRASAALFRERQKRVLAQKKLKKFRNQQNSG